jgi:CBS domain-containing protein
VLVVHVRDVMTTDVVTVGLDATYSEMVDLLLSHDISGLPVVDADGILLGLVTEADLVSREAYAPERRRPLGLVADYLRNRDPVWLRKASGTTALEIMTHVVTTASPDDELRVAARRLLESGYKRLPVVATDGRLAGIVSRRDVLALAYIDNRHRSPDPSGGTGDAGAIFRPGAT